MIRFEGGFFLLVLALDVFCVIDLIQTRDDEVRNLPKIAWLILILLFPPIGSIAWLAAGRPQPGARRPSAYERSATSFPEYDRPGRAAGVTPESDEEFLRKIRERADEQRRKAAEDKKRREAEENGGA
ncbi:PLD nuclease N-terminal domain-containing protein [Nocardioides marmorisolisilvae]|uniref:PLDc_N domain-containing protein n=1 Tax=Nocardioides marmorisolisilvae TaxID=1542737 RepID=A0A3N0DSP4_9ACTN|nr:PLD nuclease N-terminal domain-containing protein [Nocardioides marmorisolisilvae]RNL78648.1 PLDc_N domain-containing protein [Nocardioides marmorisolisilvae]